MVITLDKISTPVYSFRKRSIQPAFGDKNNTNTTQETEKTKNYLAPIGIITGGAALLYLGLKNFTRTGKLKTYVNEQFSLMDLKRSEYSKFVKQTINSIFPEASSHIKDFKTERFFSSAEPIRTIKTAENITKLLENQDNAFELLHMHNTKFYKGGATPYDNFTILLEKIRRSAWAQAAPKRDQINMELQDIANLPNFSDGSHQKLVKLSYEILNDKKEKTIERMNKFTDEELGHTVTSYARDMMDTIVEIRTAQNSAKEAFINNAFKRANQLLGNESEILKPTYSKIPTLDEFSKLTPEQLKPQPVPEEVSKIFENNTYFQAILEKDFNNIDIEDLKQLFYGSPYENNLRDLGYLIDRMRLRQAVAKENSETYEVIIPKLQYLSNKLHEFGEAELVKKCSQDFSNMSTEQRKGALYYVNVVARHLGYESILKMDDAMVNNYNYKDSYIRSFMSMFRKNPETYFI